MEPGQLDDLAAKLTALLPEGVRGVREDLQKNFRAVLQSGLERFDLVTRDEFDAQTAVLRRTRERLEDLEKQVAELEDSTAT